LLSALAVLRPLTAVNRHCTTRGFLISVEKEDVLSFDLHPSWWFGRRMDDGDYEWRYWADFYSRHTHWYLGHACLSMILNTSLREVRGMVPRPRLSQHDT